MPDNKHTKEELKRLQALPLAEKIDLSKLRIVEWYEHYDGKVSVSYSGGKDSTVLLHLVRSIYPEVPAVYADTRLDFPEVREHVKNTDNVIWLTPKLNFRQVIDEYDYCYPSKEVAKYIEAAKRNVPYAIKAFTEKSTLGDKPKQFLQSVSKWKWLLNADIKISEKCCHIMKERPIKKFLKENGLTTYVGIMAYESLRRKMAQYQAGCNAFKSGKSKPISFWTEQDILQYIINNNLKIPSVYGDIIDKNGKLTLTGERRTGCIFCPIGTYLESPPNKFQRLKKLHPKLYRYCMQELGLNEFLTAVGVEH